jgi:exodeoxyribonuclease V beta subunit
VKAPTEFNVFDTRLDGVNLIEASAGTGKTWNICGLYLRLLLERNLDVQRILVVTFTNAATAELRERIRARIVETLAYLRGGTLDSPSGDPFVPKLLRAVAARTNAHADAIALLLDQALQHFDEAAIFTIHGFCQRALADAAWSAGLPLALEFASDDTELVAEAVRDFWRARIAGEDCPPLVAAHLQAKRDSPDKFQGIVKRALGKPLARNLWPAGVDLGMAIDTAALDAAYAIARDLWVRDGETLIARLIAIQPQLNQQQYKPAAIERTAAAWDTYLRSASPLAREPREIRLDLLGRRRLGAGKKAPAIANERFFAAADELLAARDAVTAGLDLARLALLRDILAGVPNDVRRRKRERRTIAFDDMLYNLHAALEHDDHPELERSLREKYPVALIDEFQDTDPLQFAIFRRIYSQKSAAMFMVGDPKQAIYSFRNADLHTYLRARESASGSYTLAHNQRSTPALIGALNGLFGANANAFVLQGLGYHGALIGERPRVPLRDDTEARADFELWMLPQATPAIPKYMANREAVAATAAEIARLVAAGSEQRITLGSRALRANDIAVLVRTHAQGTEIKQALAALAIGSVELAQASVFRSIDAEEVERVLQAIANPAREALLRGALATEMLGCSATDVIAIAEDEARLAAVIEQFAAYRDLWLRRGVGVMYRRLLREHRVSARILARTEGERRLTNLLHLGELIHQAATTHDSPDALLRWLATQRREDTRDEAAQLRLESDQNLVQIVTIHRSKGLEFPVVFCPFAWDGLLPKNVREHEARQYHDDDGAAVIDFRRDEDMGAEKAVIDAANKRENAAERVRLLYVAMTRAIHRCYVIAGSYRMNGPNGSAKESNRSMLNWLVAGGHRSADEWLDGDQTADDIAKAWQAYAHSHPKAVSLRMLPIAQGVPLAAPQVAAGTYSALTPPRTIPPAWRYASFSGHDRRCAHRHRRQRSRCACRRARHRDRRANRSRSPPTTSCDFRADPVPAIACMRCSSASTSPIAPAGTTRSGARWRCTRNPAHRQALSPRWRRACWTTCSPPRWRTAWCSAPFPAYGALWNSSSICRCRASRRAS